MDIYWLGQACFKLKGKSSTALIDPFDPAKTNLKLTSNIECNVVVSSHDHFDHNNFQAAAPSAVRISGPGEYEVAGISIVGVVTYHDNTQGSERGRNTVYQLTIDNIQVVHLGDLGHKLTEDQVQNIGGTDILLVPVGGYYTIDAKVAAAVVAQLEPSIVIPMHYSLDGHIPNLEGVGTFLKEMGVEGATAQNKFSITKDKLPEETQVVLLQKVS